MDPYPGSDGYQSSRVPITPGSTAWKALSAEQQELLVTLGAVTPPTDYQPPTRCAHQVKNFRDVERDIWEPTSCRYLVRRDGSCPGNEWHLA